MLFIKKAEKIYDRKAIVDAIEAYVYKELKPLGFRKFGRTLHRFVSGDISQVINFQTGCYMWVNIGIRIPECSECSFSPCNDKKYYYEYECTIRSRLGSVKGKSETSYDFSKDTEKMSRQILEEIQRYVLPAFDVLCNREAILAKRCEYPNIDVMNRHAILLDECFIYGRMGDVDKARRCFLDYYHKVVAKYEKDKKYRRHVYLKKGETAMCVEKKIVAEKNGFYTIFDEKSAYIRYLEELAERLGFELK